MTLRDTLTRIKERQDQELRFDLDKPKLVTEWKTAVAEVMQVIRAGLAEYESDGSMRISAEPAEIQEESLGSYFVEALTIVVGSEIIVVRPVGRLIAGAIGRVDIYRQGQPGEGDRIILLREAPGQWSIALPPDRGTPIALSRSGTPPRQFAPLAKETLEAGVDFLLRQGR